MLITVKTLTGKEIEIDLDEVEDNVMDIKEKIEEKEGIPPSQQRLIFAGKQLDDEQLVSSYEKIKGGITVHLVLALRGGL